MFISLHLVGLVGYNLVLRSSAAHHSKPLTQAAILQIGIAIPALIISFFQPPNISNIIANFWLILATVVLTLLLHVSNAESLKYLEAGTHAILYNLRLIIISILGFFLLNEQPTSKILIGGIMIILAIFILNFRDIKKSNFKGVLWAILCATSISILTIAEKKLLTNVSFIDYLASLSLLLTPILMIIAYKSKQSISLKIITQPRSLLLMILRAAAAYGFVLALSQHDASTTSLISGTSVVLIMIFAAIFLRERSNPYHKIIATALTIIGTALIIL